MRGGRFFCGKSAPDVVIPGEAKIDLETLWPHMLGAVQTGLRHLDAMREEEGRNISQDVARRVDLIEEKLSFLEERAPEAVKDYEKRLEERLLEALRAHGAGTWMSHVSSRKLLFMRIR